MKRIPGAQCKFHIVVAEKDVIFEVFTTWITNAPTGPFAEIALCNTYSPHCLLNYQKMYLAGMEGRAKKIKHPHAITHANPTFFYHFLSTVEVANRLALQLCKIT